MSDCYAILEISDGSTTVNLIGDGLFLNRWRQAVLGYKEGGTRVSSPLADGQQLVMTHYEDIIDEFVLSGRGTSPDRAIQSQRDLLNLLDKGTRFWTTEWQTTPVYIRARAKSESETRYAIVKSWALPELNNPYAPPFLQPDGAAVWEELALIIEHRPWLESEPGTGESKELGAREYYVRWLGNVDSTEELQPTSGAGKLTHIFDFNNTFTRYSSNLLDLELPYQLVREELFSVQVNDLLLFGSSTADPDGGQFSIIMFDLQESTQDSIAWTWEYYNGATWTTLTILLDQTNDAGAGTSSALNTVGVGGVRFLIPFNWTAGTFNGVTAYWIRLRVTAVGGSIHPPVVRNRHPYTQARQEVFVANHRKRANITDAFYYDASAAGFSSNLMTAALPVDLLGGGVLPGPTAGDYVAFGCDTSRDDSGPFCSLVFDLVRPNRACTMQWQYWTGAAWAALTVQDNTNQEGRGTGLVMDTMGIQSVHWIPPSAWATTAVNGVTGYWVRAYVSFTGLTPHAPQQRNRRPYSIVWPYVEMQANQVTGDLPALVRAFVYNQLDVAGWPNPITRVVAGLRSLARSPANEFTWDTYFTSHINFSDEQNPDGITVTGRNGAAFATSLTGATGRVLSLANVPAAATTMATVSFGATIIAEYEGLYRAFVRGVQTSGSAGDLRIRLEQQLADTTYVTSDWVEFPVHTGGFVTVAELGIIRLPLNPRSGRNFPPTSGAGVAIVVYGDGAVDVTLIDLILIPADEWICDLTSVNTAKGSTGRNGTTGGSYIEIDSISDPARPISSDIAYIINDRPIAPMQAVTAGPAIVQADTRQRLYFLMLAESSGGIDARQEAAASVSLKAVQRYRAMRGAS